jgi:beta-glucosidase-like glycosyl hydrolase
LRLKCILLVGCLSLSRALVVAQSPKPLPYQDPKLAVEKRVSDLLQRMTLEEKAAQLGSSWQNRSQGQEESAYFVDGNGVFDATKAATILKDGVGQISRPSEKRGPAEMAGFVNQIQHLLREKTRLGIPATFHEECLHGHAAPKGTSFPQSIALASTWNPGLVRDIFASVAQEVRARGAQQCLMPVVDVARDPRWGRTEETYGEDPYLVSRMGVAAVEGLQGNSATIDREHVFATLKHFAVHGQSESGTNVGPANYSEHVVREYFLPPFEAAIREAHARSIMPSYNEVDGIPNHSNEKLLRGILRNEWGFDGLVVSDYFALNDLVTLHHVAADCSEAALYTLRAGVDIELPFTKCYATLPALVRSGKIPESLVDESVKRVLRAKFELGLFDEPYADPQEAVRVTNTPEHQQLALEAARQSITLLKNARGILPLDLRKLKAIAVIGPNAEGVHLGGYSDAPGRGVSVLQGIRQRVGNTVQVLYAEGCRITESEPDWYADSVTPADPELDRERIAKAVKVAAQSDVVIAVVGENEQTSREAWSPTHLGDRDSLDLLGRQDELIRQVIATGKPVVVVLLHGRPNSINYIAENANAILDGWYLGQEGGTAIAEVIFGDYNPAGRLPISVPRSVGQLPHFYNIKPSARRGYLFGNKEALFPFGYGLSYTTFKYSTPRLSADTISTSGSAKVSVDVTNTGMRVGDEVVQLYIRDEISSVTRPIKELRGFQRISLKPGEMKTVELVVGRAELQFYNREMKRVVEPGKFIVMVGPNSNDLLTTTLTVTP